MGEVSQCATRAARWLNAWASDERAFKIGLYHLLLIFGEPVFSAMTGR